MTCKKAEPMASNSRTLRVEMKPGESLDYLLAKTAASPYLSAASTVIRYGEADVGELSVTDLVNVLKEQADTIRGGDLSWIFRPWEASDPEHGKPVTAAG